MCARLNEDVVVLSDDQDAVERGEVHRDCHVTRELIKIKIPADSGGEFGVAGGGHELAEFDDPLLLFIGEFRLGIIGLVIGRPVIAQVGEGAGGHRLEDVSFPGAEAIAEEILVDVLHDGIESEVRPLVPARNGHIHSGIGRARRGHTGISVELVRQHFIHPARVRDIVVQVDLANAREPASLLKLVDVHLHRTLRLKSGLHPCAITLVAHGNVAQHLTIEVHIRMHIFELDAGSRRQAVAFALFAAQAGASAGARTSAQCHVQARAKLIFAERSGPAAIPCREPLLGQTKELISGESAVPVSIALAHEGWNEETRGTKINRTGRPGCDDRTPDWRIAAWHAKLAGRFHRLPLFGGEREMDCPDCGALEEFIGRLRGGPRGRPSRRSGRQRRTHQHRY